MKRRDLPEGVSLFWRSDKRRFVVNYPTPNGPKQKLLPIEFDRRARAKARAYVLELVKRDGSNPVAGPKRRRQGKTFAEAVPLFLALMMKDVVEDRIAPATHAGYRNQLNSIVLPFTFDDGIAIRDLHVEDLAADTARCRAFVRAIRPAHSPSRVRNICSTVRLFLDICDTEKWARVLQNPFRTEGVQREIPQLPTSAERGGVVQMSFTWAQTLVERAAVPMERRVRYALAYTAGAREGELAGLTWGAFFMVGELPFVRIEKAFRLIRAEGETLGRTKTRSSIRQLPVHPAAVDALRDWAPFAAKIMGRPLRATDPVFPREIDGAHYRPESAELLRADLAACELPIVIRDNPVEMRMTRRSFATALKHAHVDKDLRKRLMGHALADVTEENYTEAAGLLYEAIAKLPLAWPSSAPSLEGGSGKPKSASVPKRDESPSGSAKTPRVFEPHGALAAVEFLNRRSQVRFLPGAPKDIGDLGDPVVPSGTDSGTKTGTGSHSAPQNTPDRGALSVRRIPIRKLPPDVQDAVADALDEAYAHVFDPAEPALVLAPLAKAARAIQGDDESDDAADECARGSR